MDEAGWQRVDLPVIAGDDDLALLRSVQPGLPATIGEHLRSTEVGGQELAQAGFQVDLVPVWASLFFAWCDEEGLDPDAADAIELFIARPALIDVRYRGYRSGSLDALAALEEARSRAIAAVLACWPGASELTVSSTWSRAVQLLRDLYTNARSGTQLDVLCPGAGPDPIHWHLDGSTCQIAVPTVDHVLVALLESLGSTGTVIVVDDGLPIHEVRVWSLGFGAVVPLAATSARTICQPEPGSQLLDAWGA